MDATQRSMDLFLDACGASGPLEVDVTSPGNPRPVRRTFRQPFLLIGHDARSNLPLTDPHVNPCHAYLQVIAGRVYCVDLRKQEEPERARRLKRGRGLLIGDFFIRLAESGPQEPPSSSPLSPRVNPLAPDSAAQTGCPGAVLELLNSKSQKGPRPLTRVLTLVGRSPDCGLRLLGESVSDFHCSLLSTPWGTWVIDLLSEGGVLVNERRVPWARLEDGARLLVGKFYYRLRYLNPPPPLPIPAARAPDLVDPAPVVSLPSPLIEKHLPATPGGVPSVLAPFLGQFGLMQQQMLQQYHQVARQQQQMCDQFHQAMTMLLDLLGTVHQDGMALVREELGRLHQLTEELTLLRGTLAKRASAARLPGALLGKVSEPAPGASPTAADPGQGSATTEEPSPRRASAAPWSAPSPEELSNKDSYEWLYRRIEALQGERQSLWQKVLGRVLGSGTQPEK